MSHQEQDFVGALNAVHPIMRLWAMGHGYTRWQAEDAVQTAATETWAHLVKFPDATENDFRALLVYFSKFRLIDGCPRELLTLDDGWNDGRPWDIEDGCCDVDDQVEARLRLAALLTQRGGDAALLNALGFSYREIAAVDGRAPETLKVAACHARAAVESEWS